MSDITLFDYFAIIRKRWLLILLIPIVAVALSSIYVLKDNEPIYEARAKIAVGKRVGDEVGREYFYVQLANKDLVDTYMNIAKTGIIAERIASQLLEKPSAGFILSGLQVSKVPETQILDIKFRHADPQKAAEIANIAAETIIKRLAEIENSDVALLVDTAVVPSSPLSSAGKMAKVMLSGILGLLFSILLAFILEFSRNPELRKLR